MQPFITTFTGRKVNPLDLQPNDINIIDIAHHLSLLNRFVGATHAPISVAQHSVWVSELVDGKGCELAGLLHDAPEAYLGDVSKWVKQDAAMRTYREAESRAWRAIAQTFNIPVELPHEIEEADKLMVRVEAFHTWQETCHMFTLPSHPCPTLEELERVDWHYMDWRAAQSEFLRRFHVLTVSRRAATA